MPSIRDTRRPHDLYRFYDALDRLLYIGISLNAATRASQHKTEKSWWGEVRRMEVTPLGTITRFDAERIEREAIEEERPRHNVVHNTNRVTTVGRAFIWGCEICGEPIDDGDGYVELPASERRRYTAELKHWESLSPKLLDQNTSIRWDHLFSPTKAHWWAIHRTCDENINGGGYWFDVARIRTHTDVLQWTSHLMTKRWIGDTDWAQLISHIASNGSNGNIRTDNA